MADAVIAPRVARLRPWRDVLVVWLAARVLIEGVALIAVGVAGPVADARPGFAGVLHHWDANWFDAIAQHGYFGASYVDAGRAPGRPAFFPGYPLLTRAVAWVAGGGKVTDGSTVLALWFVPVVASFVAAYFVYRLAGDRYGVVVARWSTGLLLAGPYAVFLVASYSEALYLAAAVAAAYAFTRQRYLLAGLLGAVASFTRINGAFLAVALLVAYVEHQRATGSRPRPGAIAALTTSFAGVAAYLGWLWAVTGRPTAWFDAQADRFGHRSVWPWTSAINQLKVAVTETRWDYRIETVLEIVAALALLLAVIAFVRARQWAGAVYVALSMIAFLTNVTYLSIARNTLTLFPVMILAAVGVASGRRRPLVVAALVVAGAITLLETVMFALGHWAD